MGLIGELGRRAWRKWVLDGVSASGENQPSKVQILDFVENLDVIVEGLATKDELAEAELVGSTFYDITNNVSVSGGNVVDVPFDPQATRVAVPGLSASQALVGGVTSDFGVFAPAGVRGDPNNEDPDAEVDAADLIVSQGGSQETISGGVFPFKGVRTNGHNIVARREGIAWPHDRARCEGIYGGPLWPCDESVVYGISANGQSTMAGTKGFNSGTSIIPAAYINPPDYARITMMARYATNSDERGALNRLNTSGYVQWTAANYRGVDDYFGKGGPGNVHGISPLMTLSRGLSKAMLADIGRSPMIHIHNVAVGGLTILLLGPNPGTAGNISNTNNPRNDDMIATQLAYTYWASKGKAYHVAVSHWSQGEANDTAGDGTTWAGQWATVRADRIAGYAAITGQPSPPIFLHHQISTCRDESVGRGYNSTLGQWIEHQAGRLVIVGPDYACRVHSGYADDWQHFNAVGYGHRGDYALRALRYMYRDGEYDPLHVASAVRSGTSVTLTMAGTDVTDVAIDAVAMSDPGQRGFRVFDEGAGNAEIAVTSVDKLAPMQITLTLATPPVGTLRVDCGLKSYTTTFGTTNPDGFVGSEQMRSCVRSTNSFVAYDGLPLHHWLIHQRLTGVTT